SISWDKQAQECCGEWTADGRYFVFRTLRNNQSEIWLTREKGFPGQAHRQVQLTTGPLDSVAAIPSHNGKQLFTIELQPKTELLRDDLRAHEFAPYLAGTSGRATSAS